MAEELSAEEQALLDKHRKEKAKTARKVKVKGKHAESGAEYEFDLDGDEAERVIARHKSLFTEEKEEAGEKKPAGKAGHPYFRGKTE